MSERAIPLFAPDPEGRTLYDLGERVDPKGISPVGVVVMAAHGRPGTRPRRISPGGFQ